MEAPQTQDFRGVWSGQDVESVFLEGGSGKEAYGFLVLGNEVPVPVPRKGFKRVSDDRQSSIASAVAGKKT